MSATNSTLLANNPLALSTLIFSLIYLACATFVFGFFMYGWCTERRTVRCCRMFGVETTFRPTRRVGYYRKQRPRPSQVTDDVELPREYYDDTTPQFDPAFQSWNQMGSRPATDEELQRLQARSVRREDWQHPPRDFDKLPPYQGDINSAIIEQDELLQRTEITGCVLITLLFFLCWALFISSMYLEFPGPPVGDNTLFNGQQRNNALGAVVIFLVVGACMHATVVYFSDELWKFADRWRGRVY